MRRRAHLVFSGLDTVEINTSYIAQKSFHIPSLPDRACIDLVTLEVVSSSQNVPFFARHYSENDAWKLYDMGLIEIEEMEKLDEIDNVIVVWGVTNAAGDKEPMGCVYRGKSRSFEVWVP